MTNFSILREWMLLATDPRTGMWPSRVGTVPAPTWALVAVLALVRGVSASCSVCTGLSVTSPCISAVDMATFWANGQVANDLGATFGDLHSISNKYVTNYGDTTGSLSFTFGDSSQYLFADFAINGKCNSSWGQNYDGVQLVVAAHDAGVTFDIHVQLYSDTSCTTVIGDQDVIFHSLSTAQFFTAYQYIPFATTGIDRARIKDWLITNVLPVGSTIELGCSSLYKNDALPPSGYVDLAGNIVTLTTSASFPAMTLTNGASATNSSATSAASILASSPSTTATTSYVGTADDNSGFSMLPILAIVLPIIFLIIFIFGCVVCRRARSRPRSPNRSYTRNSADDMQESLVGSSSAVNGSYYNLRAHFDRTVTDNIPNNYYYTSAHATRSHSSRRLSFDSQNSSILELPQPAARVGPAHIRATSLQGMVDNAGTSIPVSTMPPSRSISMHSPVPTIAADHVVLPAIITKWFDVPFRNDISSRLNTSADSSVIGSSWHGVKEDISDVFANRSSSSS
ncbi:hypothetical protein HDU84_009598 [Entophlyctis sp. JEL0112]|nr:hypothetical protein HDU84_009598 [Entophlyctis sp. JEL0112]